MPNDVEKFKDLKARAERLQTAADRAAGVRDAELATLKEEWGCATVKEAKRKLAELEREADKAEAAYAKALEEFEAEWGETLEEYEE